MSIARTPLTGPLALLEDGDRDWLFSGSRERTLERDEVLLQQGERDREVHVLLSGRCRVVATTSNGRSILLSVVGPGDVLGELSAIDGDPRSATVSALEQIRVRTFPGTMMRELMRRRPDVAWAVLEVTVERLRRADRRFLGVVSERTRTRVARTLLELAAQHGRAAGDGIKLDVPLSQEELAGLVGASREGVAAVLSELRSSGALSTGRMAVTLHDIDELREIALGA